MVGDSTDETNFQRKLLSTNTKVPRICKAFGNGSLGNITFSKTQLSKMVQLEGVMRNIPIFGNVLLNLATKGIDIAKDLRKDFLDKQIDRHNKEYITGKYSGITLAKNEIKDSMKVI